MAQPKVGVIIGSTRQGRFADHPATWITDTIRKRGDLDVEVLDLRDYPLPFFDESGGPAYTEVRDETARKWQKALSGLDGFVVTAAEYNHGPTAVLKNALDYAYKEWNNKPIAFVGYGGTGGVRSVEQLRMHAIELQMAPIRNAVHIPFTAYMDVVKQGRKLQEFDFLNDSAKGMLDQFVWWVNALKTARASG